ncbi:MAG: NAD(P)/FAD-dependent oxidoreductase [Acidimicrobiaceae bacterium]|nr:NAD(P)/FAD-dependent oxidoreductase [Acidimicrobiaceae bacterium]MYC43395.1 NAD(P)/FAD-dependent oxidoreductase [Acidimicrobiaceae bacterium]MYD07208.1 NAD(P)/FAD-dependent oxidoreductase [Acidimicrobiaceae bacterium]MYI59480.1 NAD(P)/FAD-dependent oxidoreductase [Acidimicrobiaceae bacterium]
MNNSSPSATAANAAPATPGKSNSTDVLVVGAGISGIGVGYYLQNQCPDRTFAILEGRPDIGGTWDLFRYPGVRSDSDMHTLGYSFKPWTADKSIADGPAILDYLKETIEENDLSRRIHFNRRVQRASWSSVEQRWTVEVEHTDTGEHSTMTAKFLSMCSGYYSYREGFTPEFPGVERYEGQIVHPQAWPEDLDYKDKRVVVIGSGATAVTLVPAMATDTAHITMLQRSPTYMAPAPAIDPINQRLKRVLPERIAYWLTRWKNIVRIHLVYRMSRTKPERLKERLLDAAREALGPDYDIDTHFTPQYNPWDQRLCLIPDGDLYEVISNGSASVVTDTIKTFTEKGILLESGAELEADIIVTATGLQLVALGQVELEIDGQPVNLGETWTYKGMAFSDVPNLVTTFGYINSSWTLRVDLNAAYLCRLLNHMRATGTTQCTPRLRPTDHDMVPRPFIDDFPAGYIKRAMHLLPRQGDREPWLNTQNYLRDRKFIGRQPVDDDVMEFTIAPVPAHTGR